MPHPSFCLSPVLPRCHCALSFGFFLSFLPPALPCVLFIGGQTLAVNNVCVHLLPLSHHLWRPEGLHAAGASCLPETPPRGPLRTCFPGVPLSGGSGMFAGWTNPGKALAGRGLPDFVRSAGLCSSLPPGLDDALLAARGRPGKPGLALRVAGCSIRPWAPLASRVLPGLSAQFPD